MLLVLRFALSALLQALRDRQDLVLENLALRHQIEVLTRNRSRPRLRGGDRLLWSWLSRIWFGWRRPIVIVQPDTVVRWHRSGWRRYWSWRGGRRSRPGRPVIDPELQTLIRRMTRENPRWGHLRVLGELRKLGFQVSLQTVRRYRDAVPRPSSPSWHSFLSNHRPQLWACDFFTVQTVTFRTLFVFFIIAHERPAARAPECDRPSTGPVDLAPAHRRHAWGSGPRFLLRDRDRAYGREFVEHVKHLGIETILTPIAAPQANAIAERVVGTLRRECLDHLIIVNERHLRLVLREFVSPLQRGAPASSACARGPARCVRG